MDKAYSRVIVVIIVMYLFVLVKLLLNKRIKNPQLIDNIGRVIMVACLIWYFLIP